MMERERIIASWQEGSVEREGNIEARGEGRVMVEGGSCSRRGTERGKH